MDENITDLDKDTAEHLCSILDSQVKTSFNGIIETDKWQTQHNFLSNAGGAAAVLGYLSSTPTPTFALLPLIAFLFGVVASGIEIRFLLMTHKELFEDAMRRRNGFVSGKLSVADGGDVQAPKASTDNIKYYSGIISQSSFVIGCVMGILGYLCK